MLSIELNKQGDSLEVCSDGVVLNLSYWECECESNWIHHVSYRSCSKCKALAEDCSNAIEQEVQTYLTA